MNLAGAEFGTERAGFSSRSPGEHGRDYLWPGEGVLAYFYGRGVRHVRVPFRWERIQPNLGAGLDAQELGRLWSFVESARRYGVGVMLDLHNFGRYSKHERGGVRERIVDADRGDPGAVTREHLADLWSRISSELMGHPAVVGYGLMNEPHDMGNSSWRRTSQHVLDSLRARQDPTTVYVCGDGWSKAHEWVDSNGADAWLQDPAGQVIYEAHCYFDQDASGRYRAPFGGEVEGWRDPIEVGVQRLDVFAGWCERNRVQGFIGEYGVPRGDARWLPLLRSFLDEADRRGIATAYWAAGEWWGDYPLSVQPSKLGHDAPQLATILA